MSYLRLFNGQEEFIININIFYSISKCNFHSTLVTFHPGYETDGSYDGNNIFLKG